jgi:hypothetical protein
MPLGMANINAKIHPVTSTYMDKLYGILGFPKKSTVYVMNYDHFSFL